MLARTCFGWGGDVWDEIENNYRKWSARSDAEIWSQRVVICASSPSGPRDCSQNFSFQRSRANRRGNILMSSCSNSSRIFHRNANFSSNWKRVRCMNAKDSTDAFDVQFSIKFHSEVCTSRKQNEFWIPNWCTYPRIPTIHGKISIFQPRSEWLLSTLWMGSYFAILNSWAFWKFLLVRSEHVLRSSIPIFIRLHEMAKQSGLQIFHIP